MASTTAPQSAVTGTAPKQKYYQRFDIYQRIEHAVMLSSFTVLAITGLPQKFAAAEISQSVLALFGGIEATRLIHRTAAIVMIAASVWHILALLYRILVKRVKLSMLPVPGDFVHLFQDVMFYLGRRKHKAYYGRYSYAEKVEYFAFVWGTLVMVLTGFMMWNPIATTVFLPGEAIPAAKAAHGGEALLAVLAIILWHFYHVHLKHLNKSMFTGKMSRDEMEHEHPAELALIESGKADQLPPAIAIKRRRQIFFPIAGVIVAVVGIGLFQFATFEKTAIETVPPGEIAQAFVPFTPTPTATPTLTPMPTLTPTPSPTPKPGEVIAPAAGDAWSTTISAILTASCKDCHIDSNLGGISLKSYADAIKTGAIVPGQPEASKLVEIQRKGGHAGQLTDPQLAQIVAWIQSGASENPTVTARASEGWTDGIDQLVAKQCAACHVDSQLGGLSLKTYADALKGAKSGPVIVPGDPNKSVLVKVQQAGDHSGQFTPDELTRVIAWIKAGAPEQATGGATAPVTAFVWKDGVDLFVVDKCAACHVSTALGGLSLKTYSDALKGGKSGPVIVPGDPEQSLLVKIQQAGKHAGQFSNDELAKIIEWIKAGALETTAAVAVPAASTLAAPTPTAIGPTAMPTATPTVGPTPEPTLIPD